MPAAAGRSATRTTALGRSASIAPGSFEAGPSAISSPTSAGECRVQSDSTEATTRIEPAGPAAKNTVSPVCCAARVRANRTERANGAAAAPDNRIAPRPSRYAPYPSARSSNPMPSSSVQSREAPLTAMPSSRAIAPTVIGAVGSSRSATTRTILSPAVTRVITRLRIIRSAKPTILSRRDCAQHAL
jgi:hypothetical protein